MPLRPARLQEMTASARSFLRQFDPQQQTGAWYAIVIVGMGLLGGAVGIAFRLLMALFQIIYYGSSDSILNIAQRLPWQLCLLGPAAGALIAALILRGGGKGPEGEGTSELMEAIEGALRTTTRAPPRRIPSA